MPGARFFVARYIPDLLKQEPRNIGVFLPWGDKIYSRFLGERESGNVDRRQVRGIVNDTEAYQEWVRFWKESPGKRGLYDPVLRETVAAEPMAEMAYFEHVSSGHYAVADAGEALGESDRSNPEDVLQFIFTAMVEEMGIAAALERSIEETESPSVALSKEVAAEFSERGLLGNVGDVRPGMIIERMEVKGTLPVPHRPDFAQLNGALVLMATVDFTIPQRVRAQEHAGTAAFIFDDVAKTRPVNAVSIIKGLGIEGEHVKWGESVLGARSQIVDWEKADSKARFLQGCALRIAH